MIPNPAMQTADGTANFRTLGRINPLDPSGLENRVMKKAIAETEMKA